jgi:membrane protease YdiL (CAAX protease family)
VSAPPSAAVEQISFDNPWIVGVDGARRAAPAWLVLLAGCAGAAAVGWLSQALGPALMPAITARVPGPAGARLGVALLYGLVFLPLWAVAAVGGRLEGRAVWRAERRPGLAAAAGLSLGVGGFLLAVGLAAAAGVVSRPAGAFGELAGPLFGLLVFAYQAGAEELVFRGWMQPVLCARLGPGVGLTVVAVAFGLLHLVGAPHGPLALVNLVLAGFVFGLLALRSGGLWAAFCAHAGWNWTESCGLGLDPNPGVGPLGALADFDLAGRPLWSGGQDAMNGSLALTLVLGAIVAGLVALRPKRP